MKTYTYDSANRLVQVSEQLSVTSLSYNGLGQRLSMDAAGVIAHYVMDGDRPLTAESAGNTTFYLYGLGAIGEETNAWAYSLPDGTNTPRQLSDLQGSVTLSTRYTPWGDTLETYGTGNFTFGYFGGVLDATTGLLYVGNGQYYDPSTGRFLTRDVYPNSTNPYVPWNPIGAIVGPLGLIALIFGRKKKGSKAGTFLVLLLVVGSVGMTLSACSPGDSAPIGTSTVPPTIPPTSTSTNISVPTPTTTSSPSQTSTPEPPAPNYVQEASAWNSQNPCGCNVWNFSSWETIPGLTFDKWLLALKTYGHYCSVDPSEQNIFWPEESQLSLRLILAHNIIKEFGDMLLYADYGNYKETKEAQEEAYGRQYWQHCGPTGCFIINGIADSRLISFLSASDSWRLSAEGISDIIHGGFGDRRKAKALELADRILNPSGVDYEWKNGWESNKPFHYGFISSEAPPSPTWLVNFLTSGKTGNGYHEYSASYIDKHTNNLLFVLTPNQANELCGDTICVRLKYGDPPPDWLH